MLVIDEPRVATFEVMVRGYIDTVTMPEAERVLARLKSDPRTTWLSPILDSEMGDGYTVNFDMKVPCSYVDDVWTTWNQVRDNWRDYTDEELPEGAEIYDWYIC